MGRWRLARWRARYQRHGWAAVVLLVLPLLGNAPVLSGWVNCNPEIFNMGLGVGLAPVPQGHVCFVDPSVAYFTQALGHLSAQDWLHGVVPWWNPYTGVGMPLAAEAQDEAFFLPFVLLLHFHNGWLIQRLLFQMLSGLFAYAWLRRLRLAAAAAVLGGGLFGLNGTFTLTAGTTAAPLLFLPLLLLGVEQAAAAAAAGRRMGWSVIVVAVAGSIYAGFPETAYLDGLLGGAWALLRLGQAGPARGRLLAKLAAGGGTGAVLALPLVVPFLQYLQRGDIFPHTGWTATAVLPPPAAVLQMLPLFYGAIAHDAPAGLQAAFEVMWVRIGGWTGAPAVLLALYALAPKPGDGDRAARRLLAAWCVVWQARFFGVPGAALVLNMLPGVASSDAIRYAAPAVEFAVFALAACGLDDARRGLRVSRRGSAVVGLVFISCLGLSVAPALADLPAWFAAAPALRWTALAYLAAVAAMLGLLLMALRRHRYLALAQVGILAGAVLLFAVPQWGGLKTGHIDLSGVRFLQAQAGLGRYLSAGPLGPNFPAQFGVAGVNSFQLPSPDNWDRYYRGQVLPPARDYFYGFGTPATELAAVLANPGAFAAIGVRYIGIAPSQDGWLAAPARPLPLVWQSEAMDIYQLPGTAAYAQAGPDCRLVIFSRQKMQADCRGPAVLRRTELYYPGWQAMVNGRRVAVMPSGPVFQEIALPAGRSIIRFTFLPPYTRLSCGLALLAAVFWAAAGLPRRRRGGVQSSAS